MAISLTAEAIILAINSAIKLGDSLQRAYANSIKAKTILLPLPGFDNRPNPARAHRFFKEDGKVFMAKVERIQKLFDDFELIGLAGTDQDDYIDYYIQLNAQLDKARREGAADDKEINLENMLSLLRVRQWENGKMPCNSPVKMVAGTLVEIGIDYFNQVPGALNPESSPGRAMKHFLSALDDIELSDTGDFRQLSELIIPRLFIAAAETLETLSKDISGDEKVQGFIAATSRGIAEEVMQRTRHAADDEAVKWGQLVLRSMVKNAGQYVFHSPGELFHTNEGVSRLIQSTGNVLLEAILTDPDKLDLKKGFNADMLDQVVRSGLKVIAEHPELVDGREGFREVVMGVSAAMAEAGIKNRPDLLPELVRLILEHTAGNFHLIVRSSPEETGKHLLLVAVQQLLSALAQPTTDERWRLHLPKGQLLSIAENILDEVVANPNWVMAKVGEKTLLQETLDATFRALAGLPKTERLNRQVLEMLFQINIRTVVANQAVLDRLKWGGDEQEATILQRGLDLVFSYVFTGDKVAPAARVHLLSELLRYVSKAILSQHPDAKGLLLIDLILFQDPNINYAGGFNPKLADELIHSALNVLQSHPQLVSGQVSLQRIITGVAGALQSSGFPQTGILTELIRLVLESTSDNLQLIIKTETGEPGFLLVEALRLLLNALTQDVADGQWKPALSGTEVLSITETLFDEFLQHPEWVMPDKTGDTLFGEIGKACIHGLRAMPPQERLGPQTLSVLLRLALRTVASSPRLMDGLRWGTAEEEAAILEHVFQLTVSFVFERSGAAGGQRLALLTDMLHYLLEMLMSRHPDKKGLLLLDLVLFEDPDVDYSRGFQPELYNKLIEAAIKVLDYRPDLVTGDKAFQHIIEGVMGALKASGLRGPGLPLELMRLVLACTAENIQMVLRAEDGSVRYLLVVALEPLLLHLSTRPEAGEKWRPQLNTSQVLAITEEVLDYLVIHSPLVTDTLREGTVFSETISAVFEALARLPKTQRIQPENLAWLLRTSLQTASTSRAVLQKIHWGTDEEEVIILQKALDMVFAHVFPEQGPSRAESLDDLLEYVLEFILRHHQDKKVLLLLYLILFETPELGPLPDPTSVKVEELVDAALQLLGDYPELVTRDAVWQKIIRDTAKALQDSGLSMPDLLPELLRLMLLNTAKNTDLLTGVNPDSRQYVLAVAIAQCLTAIAEKPKRGKWKLQLSRPQILEIVEMCLDAMIRNPLWVQDKLLETVLLSVFEALQTVPEERKLPYATVRLLIENSLKAVSFRKGLAIEVVNRQGRRQLIGLTYALEGLFVTLYAEDEAAAAASWTLTQTGVLDAILDSFLKGLIEGPITKEAIDEALEPLRTAVADLAENAAFSLDELLEELEQ